MYYVCALNKREHASTKIPPKPTKQRPYTTTSASAKTNAPHSLRNETETTSDENEKIITKRRHSLSSAGKANKAAKTYTNFQKSMIAASLARGSIEETDCENQTDLGGSKDAPIPPLAKICNMCNRTANDCVNVSSKHTTVLAVSDITRLPSWNIRQVLTSICSRCLFQIVILTESSNKLRLRCEKALESQNLAISPPTPPDTSGRDQLKLTCNSELLVKIASPALPQTSEERVVLNSHPNLEPLEQLRSSTTQTTARPIQSNSPSNLESLVTAASSTPQTPKECTNLNSPSNLESLITIDSSTPQTSEEPDDLYRLFKPEPLEQLYYTTSQIAAEPNDFYSLPFTEPIVAIDISTPPIPEGPTNFNSPSNLGSLVTIASSTLQTSKEHNCSNRSPYQEPLIQLRSPIPQTDEEISDITIKSSLPNSRSISPTTLQNSMLEVHHERNVSPLTTESGGAKNKNSYQKSPPPKRLELICQFCKHVCRRKDFYKRHVRICGLQSHNAKYQTISTDVVNLPPSRIFRCTLCNFTTDAQGKVRDHKRREHCKTFKCDFCEMLFTAQMEYEFHRAACESQQEIRLEIENDEKSLGNKKIPARRKTRLYSRTCRMEETLPEEDQILQHSTLPISQTDKSSNKADNGHDKSLAIESTNEENQSNIISMVESCTSLHPTKEDREHIKSAKESIGKKKISAGCKTKASRTEETLPNESIMSSNRGYSTIIIDNAKKEETTTTNYVPKHAKPTQKVHLKMNNCKESAGKKKMPARSTTSLRPSGRGVEETLPEENRTLKRFSSPRKKNNKFLKGTDNGKDESTIIIDVAGNTSSLPTNRNRKLDGKISSKPFTRPDYKVIADIEENMNIGTCPKRAKKNKKSSRNPNQWHDESMVIENRKNAQEAPSITPSHHKKSQRHHKESNNCVKQQQKRYRKSSFKTSNLSVNYIDVDEGKDMNERAKQSPDDQTRENTAPLTKNKINKSSRESNDDREQADESMVIENINEDNLSAITTYVQRHKGLYMERNNKDTTSRSPSSSSHHTNRHRNETESTITNYVRRHPKLYRNLSSKTSTPYEYCINAEDLDEEEDVIYSHYPKTQKLEAESTITNYVRRHPKLYRNFSSNASTRFDYYINEDEGEDIHEDADDAMNEREEATEYSNRFSSTNEWVEVHMSSIGFNSADCDLLWTSNREKNLYLLQRLKREVQQQYITCFEPMCSFTAFSLNDMMLHDYLDHYKKPRFYCQKCNHCFTSKVFLDFHLDVQDYGRYVCSLCGIEFLYQCKLDQHLIQHACLKQSTATNANYYSGKCKSIKCYTCNFEFLSKDDLSDHCRRQKHSWRRKFPVIKIQRSMTLRNKVPLKRKRKVTKTSRVHILILKTKRMPSKRGIPMEKYISMLPPHLKENWLPHRIGQVEFDNFNQPNCVAGGEVGGYCK